MKMDEKQLLMLNNIALSIMMAMIIALLTF